MKSDSDWVESAIYWLVYVAGAITAGYHSYVVFRMSDPWFIALAGAVAIDGITAFAMLAIKNWYGRQRLAGFIGVALFGVVSGLAQMIARREGLGETLPTWLAWVSLGLLPVSSVGSVIALGVIRSLKPNGENAQNPLTELNEGIKALVLSQKDKEFIAGRKAIAELSDADRAEMPLLTSFNSDIPEAVQKKRGPGRPPKSPKA